MSRLEDSIDIDAPDTWPPPVLAWAREASRGVSREDVMEDSRFVERDAEFRALLTGGHKLVAFHCTRLLDHEAGAIREEGLRPLSAELVNLRIDTAHAAGSLTHDDRMLLRSSNVFAVDNATRYRDGCISLLLGAAVFDQEARGLEPLLATWGGEGIRGGPQTERAFRIGRPSIVVVRVDLGPGAKIGFIWSVSRMFAAKLLGVEPCCELQIKSAIPAEDVLGIWQPGDAGYDRHAQLPR